MTIGVYKFVKLKNQIGHGKRKHPGKMPSTGQAHIYRGQELLANPANRKLDPEPFHGKHWRCLDAVQAAFSRFHGGEFNRDKPKRQEPAFRFI
jgi:hypothetical protein